MYGSLSCRISRRLARVSLNRPAQRNALSTEVMRELLQCAGDLSVRDDVEVVIVTGRGGCFSAGADLKDGQRWANQSATLVERREIASLGLRMARAWEELPQITIAAIEGYAIGGGLALVVALDWRVAARDAFVSLPEIALGIPLTWGTLPRLVNLVGPAKAKRLAILCQRIGARAACEMGLIDELSAHGRALAVAESLASRVLALPRHAVRMTKESCNVHASLGAAQSSHMAHDQLLLAAGSPESIAAREAFLLNRARTTAARTRVGADPRESAGPRRDRVPRRVPVRKTAAAAVRAPRRARRPPGTDS